jgi:hypothetical protein
MMDGTVVKSDTVTMVPNGRSRIVFTPPQEVYTLTDLVRPRSKNGTLLLRLHGPAGEARELLPSEAVPVSLSMWRLGAETTQFLFAIYVMVFLLIGGLLSLLGSSVLPNMLKKVAFRRQIVDLATRTSGISTRIDSYLRVLLRLERKKIDIALGEVGAFSLSAVERFEDVTVLIDRLSRRLQITERLDDMRRRFEEASATAPPSISEVIDRTLQLAANRLHSFALSDEDVLTANGFLDTAGASLGMLDDQEAQAKLIAANFKQLKNRLLTFPEPYYVDIKAMLLGIFKVVDGPFDDAQNIVHPMFFAIDHAIAAVQTALDYSMVRATIPAEGGNQTAEPGRSARERLLAHEGELIGLLGTLSWKSLRGAMILVQQMREGIYEDDVLREIGKKRINGERPARVVFDTQVARPYRPVYFSIAFDDPRFRGAAALSHLGFRWSFPGELEEEGVRVCHYFEGNESRKDKQKTIEAVAEPPKKEGRRGKEKKGKGNFNRVIRRIPIVVSIQSHKDLDAYDTIEGEIPLQSSQVHRSPRAFAEGMRFLIAFGVALAGLEAGALDQLAKLDFFPATIAVVALGFGADSIKNLLTQSPKKSS